MRAGKALGLTQHEGRILALAFQSGGVRCNAQLVGATVSISARLPITPDATRGGYANIDVLIDGVSADAQSLRVTDGHVFVNRLVNVTGASGTHTLVFVLDNEVRSAPQTFSHACIASTPTSAARRTRVAISTTCLLARSWAMTSEIMAARSSATPTPRALNASSIVTA
ncbi:hypothetical protein ATE48_15665 [Candidatus Viadribacter manganicus]|uniref:Uncharacterized protein n=1 Tax=Candidatus Viadribacter manganicus TaxID=1759059 RepID=A0A1B1AL23_9PROT|nr:hypothetical protein ATE48_15665 [Candidatus Viadribacter manganicus]